MQDARGNDVDLSIYKGKVLLIVNVASQCGLTNSNYKELTQLYEKYKVNGRREWSKCRTHIQVLEVKQRRHFWGWHQVELHQVLGGQGWSCGRSLCPNHIPSEHRGKPKATSPHPS
ncbi:hypothetical protein BHE74_00018127 [Ensete ventricosum]|nr:hypothetical protein GW17_00053678 [Ensete ventricosum]RWW73951.1 hypothetical protein BHE74_00018127 [Ensete ventricosum]RZR83779.1 hypothetical protein BHM03_00010483 [Ensete ventricosum]